MKWSFGGMSLPGLPHFGWSRWPVAMIRKVLDDSGADSCAMLIATERVDYVSVYEDGSGLKLCVRSDSGEESSLLYAKKWVAALTETAAEALQETYPGISTGSWLQIDDGTAAAYQVMAVDLSWTNATLYDENGAVFLEKSTPVPQWSFCRRSYLAGMGLGLAGKALPFKIRRPVAYLYNGVRLPKLPDAPEGHEFIALHAPSGAYAMVYYSTTPIYLKYDVGFGAQYFWAKEDGDVIIYYYDTSTSLDGPYDYQPFGEGQYAFEAGDHIYGLMSTSIHWANYDVRRYDDDTIWLDKTEPIPVYE